MNFKKRVNGSWTDTPHYIHNTSADTITTPAVLYPTGTTATVGLKGNTVQSTTPTPQNPVMPNGTGDMSSNLYNVSDKSATTNNIVTLVDLGADTTVNTITVSCMFDNLLSTGVYGAFLDFLKDDNTHQYVTLYNMHNVADDTSVIANTITTGNYYATKNNITFRYIKAYLYSTAYNKFQSGTIKWAFYDSEKKDYEPYGYKIPISSGGVNLFDKDNADIVDFYPDTTTREIKQSSNLSTWSIVLPVEPSTTYTFTMGEATTAIRRRVGMCSDYPTKGAYCTSVDDTPEYDHPNLGNIFTTDADTKYVLIMYVSGAGRDVAIERANRVQVVKGNTALPYEPYNRTTTPVYLGEVQTTRRVKKLVLTGDETLTSGSVIGQIRTSLTGAIDSLGLCTHYILKTSYGGAFPYIRIRSNTLWFEISPDGYETKEEALADFKSYLAQQYANGTPVTIWYVLATEETAVVNEPLMKIGDYADEVSGITIPTTAGANTISVDTTLQPSEGSVNYKGWHPVQSVHEAENGQWD